MRRRRFNRQVSRRRGGVRPSVRPQKWEAANFFGLVPFTVDPSVLLGSTVMVELIKAMDHIGDNANAQGQALSQIVRKIDIGGIVFDIDVRSEEPFLEDPVGPEYYYVTEWLCTCDLDSASNPVTIPDYLQTQKPVQIANVNSLLNEDTDFPQRTHWRRSYSSEFPTQFPSPGDAPHIRTTKSLRLKRSLDDTQGLFIGATVGFPGITQADFSLHVAGTLYYRVRF